MIGLVVSAGVNSGMRAAMFEICNNSYSYFLSTPSILIGCTLGLVMPMLSNILPIKNALGKNLRTSLDLYHRAGGDMIISVKKLQDMGLSPPQFVASTMFIVFGMLTYYVAPTAFFYEKFELFFLILNILLMGMILGMTILSVLTLPLVQKTYVHIFLQIYRKDLKLVQLIMKSLDSNSKRNTNTAIMFALCLSFLIFSGCVFTLIGTLIMS